MSANISHFNPVMTSGQESAHIVQIANSGLLVKSAQGLYKATKAASCLLKPELGDLVLIQHLEGKVWVLAVLEQKQAQQSVLAVEGNLTLQAAQGDIALQANNIHQHAVEKLGQSAQQIQRLSEQEVSISKSYKQTTEDAQLQFETASCQGKTATMKVGTFVQNAKQCIRQIKELDKLTAGNVLQTVRHTFSTQAKTTISTASGEMRIDAKRIHMG